MRIALLVEGKTEIAFLPSLRVFLGQHLGGNMPKLDAVPFDGRIPTGPKLRRLVEQLLKDRHKPADHIIALTDVYTGTQPPVFPTAASAKDQMREWVGQEPRFHPHVALHDFEAWLLPYWPAIQRLAGHNQAAPNPAFNPEMVDHDHPPARRIQDIFRIGKCRAHYVKPRDAARILRDSDLSVAVSKCSELKALVNTIIALCGGKVIP
ncbi:MAG: DUF4276 family protein [Pseudomonadota bacterium]